MWYTVKQGEDLRTIAYSQTGRTTSDALRDHPKNKDLFAKREAEILLPGDCVFVPERELRSESAATEKRHRYVKKSAKRLLHIVLLDANDAPRAQTPYRISVDSGPWQEGETDGDGHLREDIDLLAKAARLRVQAPDSAIDPDESDDADSEPLPADEGSASDPAPVSDMDSEEDDAVEPDDSAGDDDVIVDELAPYEQNVDEEERSTFGQLPQEGPGDSAPVLDVGDSDADGSDEEDAEDEEDESEEEELLILIGHLDPPDSVRGVQARLNNLGFVAGELDGQVGPRTQLALRAFQRKHNLEPTGEADQASCDKLRELHQA